MTASVPAATVADDIADDHEVDDTVKKRLGFGFWIAISESSVAPSWVSLMSPAPETSICIGRERQFN